MTKPLYEEVLGAGMAVRYNDESIVEFVVADEYDQEVVVRVADLDAGWREKLSSLVQLPRLSTQAHRNEEPASDSDDRWNALCDGLIALAQVNHPDPFTCMIAVNDAINAFKKARKT